MTQYLKMLHEKMNDCQNRLTKLRKESFDIGKEKDDLLITIGKIYKEVEDRTGGVYSVSKETETEGAEAENVRLQDENRRLKLRLQCITGNAKLESVRIIGEVDKPEGDDQW